MFTEVIENISSIDATAWDACAGTAHPFTRHAFLSALEESGCVGQKTGWLPQHIVVYSGTKKQNIVGIMPFYLKDHSYGEYVFDWAWAEAYNRAGLKYYPKLLCAIPFTPVNGARLIVKPGEYDSQEIRQVLLDKVFKLADDLNVSSIHWLFTTEQDNSFLSHAEITRRSGSQFHWHNKNYESFNDFLTDMSHKKRKNIRRERRRITDAGIKYIAISNDQINAQHTDEMFNFYTRTIQRYGAQQYLNREFFERITSDMPESVLFLFAKCENVFLAGGLFYIGDNALYGRYWGANNDYHSLHFETCYYQPIEYCINNGLQLFEAGAQGEHKLARGLLPIKTYSYHWLNDPHFMSAVEQYTKEENSHIDRYTELLGAHSPFRAGKDK
jgi:predicted N-acyltransferase